MDSVDQPLGRSCTAEQAVLLAAIRLDHASDHSLRAILQDGPHWPSLRKLAVDQGILPLLYIRLQEIAADLVPPAELAQLRTLYLASVARNLRLTQQLHLVLDVLATSDIPAIPLKGPALAQQAYGNVSLRQASTELDTLVHPDCLARTFRLLAEQGFAPPFALTRKREREMLRWAMQYTCSGQTIDLDIHVSLFDGLLYPPLTGEELWERLNVVHLDGQEVRLLSPENTLLPMAPNTIGRRSSCSPMSSICS